MNNVNIVYSSSGLGTPATGQDFISGLIFYSTSTNSITECLSVSDIENAGFTANTIANISAATYSDVIHYHVAEYFRLNPTGRLFVQTVNSASTLSYEEIVTLQEFSGGIIRQTGVYEYIVMSGTCLEAIQTQVNACVANNMPLEVIYQPDFSGYSGATGLVGLMDLSTGLTPNVSVCLGQDGGNLGAALFGVWGNSVGTVGAVLGAVSRANVADSIAWVSNFQMDAVELATPAFANGVLINTVSSNLINQIDSKQYLFLRTFVGLSGTYNNNDYTANIPTSDYTSIHLNRVIHKAARSVRAQLLPSLASPVFFNADGTIAINSVVFFQSECNVALNTMVSNQEISQFKTIINTKQNVLATKTLVITVQIVPVGVANTITLNLGFVLAV